MRAFDPVDVSIVVVSYNTRAMTAAALDSVVKETRAVSYEIIAVDNASIDGSAAMLADHPAEPQLITLASNIGFARANTLAAKSARGRYLLLLNPDTIILNGAIDKLVTFAKARPTARIWGGRTLFADGTLNPSSCWGRMTLWNLFCRASGLTGAFPATTLFNAEAIGGYDRASEREVDIVSGCFLLIPRALWDRLGGFDPAFFMYGEEADLCLRARRYGARPRVTPAATIVHHGGASEATRTAKMVKLLAAKVTLIERHWRPALVPLGRALMAAWPLSRWLALAVASRMTGRPAHAAAASAWRKIWFQRDVWLGGYDRAGRLSASTAA